VPGLTAVEEHRVGAADCDNEHICAFIRINRHETRVESAAGNWVTCIREIPLDHTMILWIEVKVEFVANCGRDGIGFEHKTAIANIDIYRRSNGPEKEMGMEEEL